MDEVGDLALPGFVGQPTGRPDVERKFGKNVDGVLPEAKARAALDALWRLERETDIGRLMALFAVVPARRRD